MRKFLRSSVIVFSLILAMLPVFSGCDTYQKPASKQVLKYVDLFSVFNSYGFEPMEFVINKDLSGYMAYYIRSATVAEKKNSIYTAVDAVNSNTSLTYSEGDYQAGYRAVYVRDKYIQQYDQTTVTVRVEFVNINYLSTQDNKKVLVQTLEDYLKENTDADVNNNFISAQGQPSSIIKIEDKQKTYVVTLKGGLANVPLTIKGSEILCYYIQNPINEVVEVDKDTIKFTTADAFIVYTETSMPVWLIIAVCAVAAAFIVLLAYRINANGRRK